MSSKGLPVDGVVGTDIVLGSRSTQQATDEAKSSLSADSAAQSADAAFKFSRQAKEAAAGVSDDADRAEAAAENAQNIADANTYYITPGDPDGTIAGIAGTPNGKSFRVGQGEEGGFKYYINNNGTAVQIAWITGKESADEILSQIAIIIEKTRPIQGSPDSLFDIVSSNGVRPFRIRDNDGTIEFEMVAKLVTGNAGLNFAGSSVDYFAPPGWLFVIYSANGLVIAGVKDDGTKVGWGDGSGGGGQSGEIIPGDTAASYDAIRQYDGEATVKDVIGNRIAGRFVVDAGDTTSPDDDGGCLVDTLGRRWKRSADYVSFDMFGAPRIPESVYQQFSSLAEQGDHAGAAAIMADQLPADTAIRACFAFANALNIPVRQDAGRFLWKNTEIEVKVSAFLSGATIVTTDISGVNQDRWGPIPGVDDNAPEPVRMFTIRGRKPVIELTPAQINLLNTTYAGYLRAGSCQLPMPELYRYRGGQLFVRSSAVEYYRSGSMTNPRMKVLYRDFARLGKNGALTDMLVKDIPAGTVTYAKIVQKEDSYLTFKPPFFHESGNSRRFVNIEVYRPQTIIGKMVLRTDAYGEAAAWVKISAHETFDVEFQGGQCEASFGYSGAYVVSYRDCINMYMHDFTGMYGWGVNGHHGTKKMHFERCVFNRIDWHTFGYDISGRDLEFKGLGINMQGGGTWDFRNISVIVPVGDTAGRGEPMQNWFVELRGDYASDCYGSLSIDGLTIKFDVTNPANLGASVRSYEVVRLVGVDGTNARHDTRTPNRIDLRNVTVDLQGSTAFAADPNRFVFAAVRTVRSEKTDHTVTGYKTLLPEFIRVEGMTAINVPADKNAWMCGLMTSNDMHKNTVGSRVKKRADGTNADVVLRDIRSVVNNPVSDGSSNNTVAMAGTASWWTAEYLNSDYSWIPRIVMDNCAPAMIDITGSLAVVDIRGGCVARLQNGNTQSRVRINGADIQLIPDTSGNTAFDSANSVAIGSTWLNPASAAVYSGTLRGAANENRGDASNAPNIPSSVFI
ncbi:hypothetical protein [Serratia marcescens]|uniref:hypothetical protein n=1 Tax=Serratia marcescens TaxID=615 RepID=UPI000AF35965|nr:hypothetical protein [Serratia marcescens]